MIMSENEKQEKEKVKIIWVDGIPCIELPPGSIISKRQKRSVGIPQFRFGQLQQLKERDHMSNMVKELDKVFNSSTNIPFFPASWKIYRIDQWGGIKELKDEDKDDNNGK